MDLIEARALAYILGLLHHLLFLYTADVNDVDVVMAVITDSGV